MPRRALKHCSVGPRLTTTDLISKSHIKQREKLQEFYSIKFTKATLPPACNRCFSVLLLFFELKHRKETAMCDPCLTRPCDYCGKRIQGAYWHCPKCSICVCFSCGTIETIRELRYPVCPMCGERLK